jgi:ABC-type lipopolysaccharide export system ATPase subunit
MNKQNELGIAIRNLATINFSELSINETIKVLLDAAQHIAKVQQQWSRITRFFSKLAIESERAQKVREE